MGELGPHLPLGMSHLELFVFLLPATGMNDKEALPDLARRSANARDITLMSDAQRASRKCHRAHEKSALQQTGVLHVPKASHADARNARVITGPAQA